MYSDTQFVINNGDAIQVQLRSKKVIQDWQTNIDPPSAIYVSIEYRALEEEWRDDLSVVFVEPSIPNFTITSDGTVDGTITIVPDGDLPEGVEFRLYIQDDETTP